MSSTISANISATAAQAVQNPQSQAAQQHTRAPSANAVAQASQNNARAQSVKPKEDKKRDIQNAKRTEAGFAPRVVRPHSRKDDKDPPSEGSQDLKVDKVDVVA